MPPVDLNVGRAVSDVPQDDISDLTGGLLMDQRGRQGAPIMLRDDPRVGQYEDDALDGLTALPPKARPIQFQGSQDDLSGLTTAQPAQQQRAPAARTQAGADDLSGLTADGVTAPAAAKPGRKERKLEFTPGKTLLKTGATNVLDLMDNLNEMVRAPTMLGKGWGAVKSVGSALSIPFTPVEAAITEGVGKPTEAFTHGAVSAETVGMIGSLGAMFFIDPIGMIGSGAKAARATKLLRDIEGTMSPTTMTPEATRFGEILSQFSSMERTANARVEQGLHPFQGTLNRLPLAERVAFQDRIMAGQAQPSPAMQQAADVFRRMQDETTIKLQKMGQVVGKNILQDANEFYLGVIWKETDAEREAAARLAAGSKRPLTGSGAFLKRKTYKNISEGLAAGERLATEDPVEMMLLKFREQHKFLYGTWEAHAMKQSGIAQFFRVGEAVPTGMAKLDDRVFRAILPPAKVTAEHKQAFDEGLREGLHKLANFLGIKARNPITSQDAYLKSQGGVLGYNTSRAGADVVSRFGNEAVVLEHEIGHQIDHIYKMQHAFQRLPNVWHELGLLAQRRVANYAAVQGTPYQSYLMSGPERMANMWNAYWHTPDMLKSLAPNTVRALDKFLTANPDLKAAVEAVKPTLRHAGETEYEVFNVPGLRLMGEWYAPAEAARVFNNYVRPSALQGPIFDSLRSMAMGLNQLQLGLSAFHATFTTLDVMVSQLSRALESGMQGHFGDAIMQTLAVPSAAITTVQRGSKLRQAILDPRNLPREERALVEAFHLGGGSIRMDAFYYPGRYHSLTRAIRDGTLVRGLEQSYRDHPLGTVLKAPFHIAGAAISDISHPIMDYLVPRQKLGVFSNLAGDWIRRNPNAGKAEMAPAMQKIWDSVDNRLGQMVYDNLFWTKTMKDLAFLTTRSVGWNVGTVRELGGGVVDAARAIHALRNGEQVEFTHRMAYAIAMPIVTGTIGATLTYLYTGHGPRDYTDYFFPRTGRKTPRGADERVIIPSYIKDVLEYDREPVHTIFSKMGPLWQTLMELYNNKDFYGGLIRDPGGDFATQGKDLAVYVANQMTPFSFRSAKRMGKEGSSIGQQAGSFLGFQAAPSWITDPKRGEAWQQRQNAQALRRRMREQATQ